MDSQILHATLKQQRAHCVGHATDPNLKTGTILDLGGNLAGHDAIDLARFRIGQFRALLMIAFDNEVNLTHMDTVLFAEHVRHFAIELDHYQSCSFNHSTLPHIGWAKVEVSTIIHWASLENDDVDRIKKAPVIIRHFSEI